MNGTGWARDARSLGLAAVRLSAPFGLWRITVPARVDPRLAASLSDEEQARAARFRFPELANRYRVAHGALRLLGEYWTGIPAARQSYEANAHGKPLLTNAPEAKCSLSYSGESIVVGWSWNHDIGVDAERLRPIAEAAELADLHCTARERQRLSDKDASSYSRAFLTVWVRKEACVKALGRGLAIAPSSFDCDVDPGSALVEIDGSPVESHVYDLKDDLLVAWARCIRMSRSDRNHRLVPAGSVTGGAAGALRG